MKQTKKILTCLLFPVLFFLVAGMFAAAQTKATENKTSNQEKEQEPVSEYVEVVNIEVIVRALKKGKPVGGLEKSDFKLFENGQPVEISSFQEIRRKVGVAEQAAAPEEQQVSNKRLFFLYFWLSEPDSRVHEALDFFFRNVYREGDYVLMMIKNKAYTITRPKQVEQTLTAFKATLDEEVKLYNFEKVRLKNRLENIFREFAERFLISERLQRDQTPLVEEVVNRIKSEWEAYKLKNISFSGNKLKAIASSLKTVEVQKWGLVFYQHDSFPLLNPESIFAEREDSIPHLNYIRREMEKLLLVMRSAMRAHSFVDEIQQIFIDANTTFHLMLANPRSLGRLESIYMKEERMHTDWQEAFRLISEATGGSITDTTRLKEALAKAIDREDIYYRITYVPKKGGSEARDLLVQTGKPRLKLLYRRKVAVTKADDIAIAHFTYNHPTLAFTLKNYRQFFDGNRLYGDVGLKVTRIDSMGELSAFERNYEPDHDEMAISMKLNFAYGGEYSVIVEATDNQTGKTAIFSKKIDIPKTVGKMREPVLVTDTDEAAPGIDDKGQLKSILRKSAAYCEKLKKVTFYFICNEEVVDSYWLEGQQLKDDRYLFDYQIIMDENGKMNETRKMKSQVDKTKKKRRKRKKRKGKGKDLTVITNFYTRYPFLMPITMLANENQSMYSYRLLDREKHKDVEALKISVAPKKEGAVEKGANYGTVWLDATDGSIFKIALNPQSVSGIEDLKHAARRKGTNLKVTDVHWYDVKRKGIRFPSRTEINGIYLERKGPGKNAKIDPDALEMLKTVFNYKKYRFFSVNVDVTDSGIR
jgi:hypothetical protein